MYCWHLDWRKVLPTFLHWTHPSFSLPYKQLFRATSPAINYLLLKRRGISMPKQQQLCWWAEASDAAWVRSMVGSSQEASYPRLALRRAVPIPDVVYQVNRSVSRLETKQRKWETKQEFKLLALVVRNAMMTKLHTSPTLQCKEFWQQNKCTQSNICTGD